MAHGFLQSFDSKLKVKSAGTDPVAQVNPKAIQVMRESGIDISSHTPQLVDPYLNEEWDYVITVCDNANETCPLFSGKVKYRLHMGFEDPSHAMGSEDFITAEFRRVRDEIKKAFYQLYIDQLKKTI
jgi:arsenate reductase